MYGIPGSALENTISKEKTNYVFQIHRTKILPLNIHKFVIMIVKSMSAMSRRMPCWYAWLTISFRSRVCTRWNWQHWQVLNKLFLLRRRLFASVQWMVFYTATNMIYKKNKFSILWLWTKYSNDAELLSERMLTCGQSGSESTDFSGTWTMDMHL